MSLATMLRLALAGTRADRFRVALTAAGAAAAVVVLLGAATLAWTPPTERTTYDGPYAQYVEYTDWRYASPLLNDTASREVLAIILALLTVPPLIFAAQAARIGAPERDRRLAAVRLAGATPGQVRLVVAAETAVALLLGALCGIGGYLATMRLAHRTMLADPLHEHRYVGVFGPEPGGGASPAPTPHLMLPTDVTLPWWVFLAVVIAVPLIGGGLGVLALRRVAVSPLGVVRRTPDRGLPRWPLTVLGAGAGTLAVHLLVRPYGGAAAGLTGVGAAVLLAVGVALATAPLGQLAARLAHRTAWRPATLLAARRLMADPWGGARGSAMILVATLLSAATASMLAMTRAADQASRATGSYAVGPSEASLRLLWITGLTAVLVIAGAGLLCGLVERTLSQRRSLASLVAAGVPRATLVRTLFWQALLATGPAVLLALALGAATPRILINPAPEPGVAEHAVPIPWQQIAWLGAGALVTVLGAVALSLPVLRASTRPVELRTE